MKKINIILFIFLALATIFTSCDKEAYQTATVVRDCTGTYLRLNSKDYLVCNLGKVASFSTGQTVTATFRKLKECNDPAQPTIICQMLHQNEGWIEVIKIK